MRTAPYRCCHEWRDKDGNRRQCQKRKSLPVGTLNGAEKCPKCGHYTMILYTYRAKHGDAKDRGERCDCNGGKSPKEDKVQYRDDVPVVLGPHRKGQAGCQHHPDFGKEDPDKLAYYEQLSAAP